MAQSHAKSRLRILVVDDVEDNRDLTQAILSGAKYEVLTAASVAEVRGIVANDADFHLILSDISMPEETGFDLLDWLQGQAEPLNQIPVLLITAVMPEDENRVRGLSLGATDYIVRPISNQELILRVRNAIENFQRFHDLRKSLESSEDMAMMGRILAAANHEIRNVTNLLTLTGDRALSMSERGAAMGPGSAGHDVLTALQKTARLLADISRNLNSHMKKEEVSVKAVSVRTIVDEVLVVARHKLAGVAIDVQLFEDVYVLADATRLKQILINFLFNAWDAIQEGSNHVSSRVSVRVLDADSDVVKICVTDNGMGFAKKGHRVEFPAFQTTKSMRGGTGLGLWLCTRFAQAMGGRISLESLGPGQGATAIAHLRRGEKPQDLGFRVEDYLMN